MLFYKLKAIFFATNGIILNNFVKCYLRLRQEEGGVAFCPFAGNTLYFLEQNTFLYLIFKWP